MQTIDLNDGAININLFLADNYHIVLQRMNNGIGDVIMSLPIFDTLSNMSASNAFYFSILDAYSIFLEDNESCCFYQQENVDLCIKFNDYFEKQKIDSHRTDLLANSLGLDIVNKKPQIYKRHFEWEHDVMSNDLFEDDYGLLFLYSNNFSRQILPSIAEKIRKIVADCLDIPLYFMGQKCIIVDEGVYDTTLDNLLFLIEHANICIGPDSGPMHIAGALDVPFMVFCNSVDPDYRYKYYDTGIAIHTHLDLDCLYQCDSAGYKCVFDFPYPCLKFFDWEQIKNILQNEGDK